MNQIFLGDCLKVLKNIPDASVDMVYLDPPFFTQRDHVLNTRDGEKFYNFSDRWNDISEYTESLAVRLRECRRVLKPTGSLFLHCDKMAVHYLKVSLDAIFGVECFQSEIIWSYRRWSNSKKGLLNHHQTILFFSKTADFKFNPVFQDYSPATNVEQIVQLRQRDGRNKAVYKKNSDGSVALCQSKNGVPLGDVWDIPFLNPKARERVGYPTQKPVLLLERLIQLTTSAGDLVLDPYCGSGTTLVAAKLAGRNYIGIDKNADAVALAKSRLVTPFRSESRLLQEGRESYNRKDLKVEAIVKKLNGTLVHRNAGIDGLISTQNQVVPFKIVFARAELATVAVQLEKASRKNKFLNKALFIATPADAVLVRKLEKKHGLIIFKNLKELNRKMTKLS